MATNQELSVVEAGGLPRLFVWAGRPRSLWILAALTLISGAAMLPAMIAMADHGASLIAFENAGTVARSEEILAGWGAAGEAAAWWQLALDLPFLVAYGLFAAGACAAVACRAARVGKPRLRRAATVLAWCGPVAAAADLMQNVSLALILAGHVAQPWSRIAATSVPAVNVLMAIALIFALAGTVATRERRPKEPTGAGLEQ